MASWITAIVLGVVILGYAGYRIFEVVNMSEEERKTKLKEVVGLLVIKAEEIFGSKKGQEKLQYVED